MEGLAAVLKGRVRDPQWQAPTPEHPLVGRAEVVEQLVAALKHH